MKRLLLAFALVATLAVTTTATLSVGTRPDKWDGTHWEQMSERERLMFMAGALAVLNPVFTALGDDPLDNPVSFYVSKVDKWYQIHHTDRPISEVLDDLFNGRLD